MGAQQPIPGPTTLWATNATISAAILLGPIAGMLTGVVVMATAAALKGYVHIDLSRNATIVIELAVGLAVGMAAQTARGHAHAELQRAARLSAYPLTCPIREKVRVIRDNMRAVRLGRESGKYEWRIVHPRNPRAAAAPGVQAGQ